MPKYYPQSDQILCERVSLDAVTKGGIILVEDDGDAFNDVAFAKVIAVGPGKQIDNTGPIPMNIKEGDIISYMANIGLKYKLGPDNFEIVRQSNVLMIVDDVNVKEYSRETAANSQFMKTEAAVRHLG